MWPERLGSWTGAVCVWERTGEVIRQVRTAVGVSSAVVPLHTHTHTHTHTFRSLINPVEPVTVHLPVTLTPSPDTVWTRLSLLLLNVSAWLNLTCWGISLWYLPLDYKQRFLVSGRLGLCPDISCSFTHTHTHTHTRVGLTSRLHHWKEKTRRTHLAELPDPLRIPAGCHNATTWTSAIWKLEDLTGKGCGCLGLCQRQQLLRLHIQARWWKRCLSWWRTMPTWWSRWARRRSWPLWWKKQDLNSQ